MKRIFIPAITIAISLCTTANIFAQWEWIDANGDGREGCYYFVDEGSGYLLENTTTPDGYQVNENGLWIENGIVQTRAGKTYDMDAAIDEIRELYSYINKNKDGYRQVAGEDIGVSI